MPQWWNEGAYNKRVKYRPPKLFTDSIKPERPWFRFSLKMLLLGITMIAVVLGVSIPWARPARIAGQFRQAGAICFGMVSHFLDRSCVNSLVV